MSLQDKLDAFKADFEGKKAPREVVAVMHKATADLIASGQAERTLKVGARAPTFALPNAQGELVRSTDLLARGPLVLTFYRGIWCPYCNMDLQAIEAAAEEIRALGASLVAISPQTAPNRRRSERENALSFPILSDHGNSVANDVWLALPPAGRSDRCLQGLRQRPDNWQWRGQLDAADAGALRHRDRRRHCLCRGQS